MIDRETTPHCGEDGTPGVTRENCPWHRAEPMDELREVARKLREKATNSEAEGEASRNRFLRGRAVGEANSAYAIELALARWVEAAADHPDFRDEWRP